MDRLTMRAQIGHVHSWWAAILALAAVLAVASCASTRQSSEPAEAAEATAAESVDHVRKEMEVGEAALAKIAGRYGVVRHEEATEYLNKMLQSLALVVERQELDYVGGILATEQVNAFALPGGIILVNLGTLKQIENPSELAGILAHELGHINKKHILDSVSIEVERSFAETLARLLSGSRQVITSAMGQINQKIEERLFLEGYAADDEYEADAYAVTLLESLGLSADPYLEYLRRLESRRTAEYMENLDATHPPLSERIERVESLRTTGLRVLPNTPEFEQFKATIDSMEGTA